MGLDGQQKQGMCPIFRTNTWRCWPARNATKPHGTSCWTVDKWHTGETETAYFLNCNIWCSEPGYSGTAAAASLPKFGRLPYRCSLVIAQDPTKLYSCRMGLAFFQGRVSVVTFPNAPASITFGEVAAVASLGNCLNLRAPIHKHRPYFWLVVSTGDSIQFWNA